MSEPLLLIDELAQWLKVPKGSLYNLVHERRIPFLKIGHRLRFDRNEIERWLSSSIHHEADGPLDLATLRARSGARRGPAS